MLNQNSDLEERLRKLGKQASQNTEQSQVVHSLGPAYFSSCKDIENDKFEKVDTREISVLVQGKTSYPLIIDKGHKGKYDHHVQKLWLADFYVRDGEQDAHLDQLRKSFQKKAINAAKKGGFDAVAVNEDKLNITGNLRDINLNPFKASCGYSYGAKGLANFYRLKPQVK